MAYYDSTWYLSSVGHAAVTARPQNTAVAAGVVRRQFTAPAVGSERCFVCIVAGTTANVTDATWVLTRGAKTTDGTATWQECTGASAVNGDATNTATWTQAKALATAVTLGAIIQRNNGASYWICSTAGNSGASEPAWTNNTAGTTQSDGTVTWTCLGVVGNFVGGGAPHARLAIACTSTWFAQGNTVYVADNHAESQATSISIGYTLSAIATIGKVLCHNHSGSYPPTASDLTTGATISATGTSSITFGFVNAGTYVRGVTFIAGVGSSSVGTSILLSAGTEFAYFDNCSFQIAGTNASAQIQVSAGTPRVCVWNNCTVKFGNAGQFIDVGIGSFTWQNTGPVLVSGSSVPTIFIGPTTNSRFSNVTLEALDLNQITGIGYTIGVEMRNWLIKDCKLNAALSILTPQTYGDTIQLVRCDSGAAAYKSSRYTYEGTETTETSITRVGGAVDPSGQAQSRKIVTTANVAWARPFNAEPYAIWNTTTGATVTVTVYGTINAGAVPNNDDIWIEVEYLGSSATPLGTIVTTTKASLLASNAAVASDSSSWNGGGSGGGWSPFKLVATLSSPQPGMAGYIDVRVRAAKASTTYYLDPKIELT